MTLMIDKTRGENKVKIPSSSRQLYHISLYSTVALEALYLPIQLATLTPMLVRGSADSEYPSYAACERTIKSLVPRVNPA